MPVRMRKGASRELISATTSSWLRSRSAVSPRATFSLGEWSVSTMYSWPRARAEVAISSIGLPPSDQSECTWQSPRRRARSAEPACVDRPALGRLEAAQVDGHLARPRLGDHQRDHLADPGELAQGPRLHPALELALGQAVDGRRGAAEGAHPVARLERPLEQEGDPPERLGRRGELAHVTMTTPAIPGWIAQM